MNAQSVKDERMRQFEELKLDVERLKQRDDDFWALSRRVDMFEGFFKLLNNEKALYLFLKQFEAKEVSSSLNMPAASAPEKRQVHGHADLDTSGPIQ